MRSCDRCHLKAGFVPNGFAPPIKATCGCGFMGELTKRSDWQPFVPETVLEEEVFEKIVKAGLAWSPMKKVMESIYISVGDVEEVQKRMEGRTVERVASAKHTPNIARVCISL